MLLKEDIEYSNSADLEAISFNQKVFGGLEYSLLMLKTYDFIPSIRLGANMTPRNDRTGGLWANATGGIGLAYKNYVIDYAIKYNSEPDYGIGICHHIAFTFKK